MKSQTIAIALGLATVAGNASAALLGVVQQFPDVTLTNNFLIYDHNGVNATTGLLRIASYGATLNARPGPGGVVGSQLYSSAVDQNPDSMMTIAINNQTGAWVANSSFNQLTIGFGNTSSVGNSAFNPNAFGFSWQGHVLDFGFLVGSNTIAFDGRVKLSGDDLYRNVPAAHAANFFDGAFRQGGGGFKINLSTTLRPTGFSTLNDGVNLFATDWVYGLGIDTATTQGRLAAFTGGLVSNYGKFSVASTIDVWVPVPAAVWLLGSAMAGLGVLGRRRAA